MHSNNKENKRIICVYGSLRKGEYNFRGFRSLEHLATTTIKGWDLYSLGPYPGIKESDNKDKDLVVDILSCNENDFNSINNMELGAGYRARQISVNVGDNTYEAVLYPYLGRVSQGNLVEHGDWLKRRSHAT